MDIKPFLHKHYLLCDDYYEEDQERCDRCNEIINGVAFTCESCKFWLHKSCAEQQLPSRISHPLHSKHLLDLFWEYGKHFMCSKCFNLSKGYGYRCIGCSFNLDVLCTSSTDDQIKEEIIERSRDIGKKIKDFSQKKSLTLVNYRKIRKYEYCCSWCEKPLSGLSFVSLEDTDEFFLHESCFTEIPNKILVHPFHPSHPLYILRNFILNRCDVCGKISFKDGFYCCHKCNFNLHVLCSKLKPTLKHYCHDHPFAYIRDGYFQCNKCNDSVRGKRYGAFYRCVQCDLNIHVRCLIPDSIDHKYHRHPLTLIDLFKEDDSAEYYCDICEELRNPKNHVYCCKKCTYIAHIECALDMFIDIKFDLGSTSNLKHEEAQLNASKFGTPPQIEYLIHQHPLRIKRVTEIEKDEKLYCEACLWKISDDEAYVCVRRCKYYLHKTCAELPFELNLDFHHHPLTLVDQSPFTGLLLKLEGFICDRCGEVSFGFMYFCFQCYFQLDRKCATALISLMASKSQSQDLLKDHNERHQKNKLFHFSHHHELLLGYFRPTDTGVGLTDCIACYSPISGPIYCCFICRRFVHESCLWKFPPGIQIPLNSCTHTLYPYVMSSQRFGEICLACKSTIDDFCYRCSQCDIYLHYLCAASLRRGLTSKFHIHNLYYFRSSKARSYAAILGSSKCGKCNEFCSSTEKSIYRCIECNTNFHLKCTGAADRVKSKCHIHNLILKDSFVEDDSGEYYCDICEEERNPKDEVYYCQECHGLFVAHIECALVEVEEVLEQ